MCAFHEAKMCQGLLGLLMSFSVLQLLRKGFAMHS